MWHRLTGLLGRNEILPAVINALFEKIVLLLHPRVDVPYSMVVT